MQLCALEAEQIFEALGKKMTKQTAIKLLTDGKVALKDASQRRLETLMTLRL